MAIALMRSHGAFIIDPVNVTGIDEYQMFHDLWSILLFTFREDIANYLAELENTTMRTLSDLIEFNFNHTDQEFHLEYAPNQMVFELSNNYTELSEANQSALINKTRQWGRELCIDGM